MALLSISTNHHFKIFTLLLIIVILFPTTTFTTTTLVEDLNNLTPPDNFNATITKNCLTNPSLRYCNYTPFDLHEIFKSTIVASHLCNVSNNSNCVDSFPKIDLHGQPKLAPLYLSFTFFWKYCPLTVLSINLSNNSLTGSFPSDVFHCSQIRELDLSLNYLNGDVPVQNFTLLQNLTFLNLSYNEFSESRISDTGFFERFNSSSFLHSGFLPSRRKFKIKAVLLLVGFPFFVIVMVVFWGWLCFTHRNVHKFSPAVIKAATDGFSKRRLVVKSGWISVYKGAMIDGSEVKIEVYFDELTRDERKRFVEQCKVLVQIHHRNIVPVLGWCCSRRFRAIVTKWIDWESVEAWLLSSTSPSWKQRVKVVLGIAAGICYLHEEWPDIGYNLKAKDILLSGNGEPLITRFKLDDHHSSLKKMNKFGVFILEIVTNRSTMIELEKDDSAFVEWVKMHYPENLENVIDKRMKKSVEIVSQATEVVKFGLMCADLSSTRQVSWDTIYDVLSNISSTAGISASTDRRRSSTDRGRVHKHVHHM